MWSEYTIVFLKVCGAASHAGQAGSTGCRRQAPKEGRHNAAVRVSGQAVGQVGGQGITCRGSSWLLPSW